MMKIINDDDILSLMIHFPGYALDKVLSRKANSIVIRIASLSTGPSCVVRVFIAENTSDSPETQIFISRIKAWQKIFQKCSHIAIPDIVPLKDHYLALKRQYYRMTLFDRIRHECGSFS